MGYARKKFIIFITFSLCGWKPCLAENEIVLMGIKITKEVSKHFEIRNISHFIVAIVPLMSAQVLLTVNM